MATGPEMYAALRAATKPLTMGSSFSINPAALLDLQKLTPEDLVELGYGEKYAKEACSGLAKGSLASLGQCMGLELSVDRAAPRLIESEDANSKING